MYKLFREYVRERKGTRRIQYEISLFDGSGYDEVREISKGRRTGGRDHRKISAGGAGLLRLAGRKTGDKGDGR